MAKFHSKIKHAQKLGYRTPDFFKGKTFGGNQPTASKFTPARFKVQHKG